MSKKIYAQYELLKSAIRQNNTRSKKILHFTGLCLLFCTVFIGGFALHTKYADAANNSLKVTYGGKRYTFAKKKQTSAYVNGEKIKTPIPGVLISSTNYICPKVIKEDSLGVSYQYNKKKKVVTLKKDSTVLKITMGSKYATVNGKKVSMGAPAQRMYYVAKKKYYNMFPARFVMEKLGFSYTWKNAGRSCYIQEKEQEVATATPEPTVQPATTVSGNAVETKAMWISYLEFGSKAKTEQEFSTTINTMFDQCVSYGMNTVIVQVRPFSDAMYTSAYYPWSQYASGKLGKNPGYDPLKMMVDAAHARGLKIQAWINPYRVTLSSTDVSALPEGHPARTWRESAEESDNRCVLTYDGKLFYNPAKPEVQQLIVNGVTEIVQNYDVDGIHFDDYFYPNLGANYKKNFDATEYNAYTAQCKAAGTTAQSIVNWRRENVNQLVRSVYAAVKGADANCEFGISPAGNIDNLSSSSAYYVDVATWMANTGYVDYICPQIYWSFQNATCPYDKTVDRWAALKTNENVKLYIGVAVYRAGTTIETEWKNCDDVLKRQIQYGREVEEVSGFGFYRYDSFQSSTAQKELTNLLPELKDSVTS